jgi:adenylate cyclase
MSGMTLSFDEVAAQTGASVTELARYVEAGVVRPAHDGTMTWGDVQRVRAVKQFLDSGVEWDHMRLALAANLITFEYTDAFFLEPSEPSGRTYGEYRASIGPAASHLARVYDTLGLAEPPDDRPMRTDEEACFRQLIDLWTRVGGEEALLRATRLLGDHVRAITDGWMALWTEHIGYVGVDAEGIAEQQERTLELGRGLTDLLPQLMVWAEQRYLEQAMTETGVAQIEQALAHQGIAPAPERRPPVVVFVDLAGFSRLTETHGDDAAVRFGTLLREVAERAARRYSGKLVKLLGDGAMLSFGTPDDAVAAGSALLTLGGWHAELPPPHIGAHSGTVIERDGDLFGGTVNIAARLSSAAGPGEFIASSEVVSALSAHRDVTLQPIGELALKNLARPVTAFRVGPNA